MRVVVQRVSQAALQIDAKLFSNINEGLLILLGIGVDDDKADADWLVSKCLGLRIFDDDQGVMNRSIQDISGEIMVVSQFTLQASTKKGNRPSYIRAARPEQAVPLYEYFVDEVRKSIGQVKTGVFGADMQVNLINNGPVTIIIDSKNKE